MILSFFHPTYFQNKLNKTALTVLFLAACVLSNPSHAVNNSPPFEFEKVMTLSVDIGPEEDMGATADGHRFNYPIIGGTFSGKGLKGVVVPGGADFAVEKGNGVLEIDALYRLKTDDGQIIIIRNIGVYRPKDASKAKLKTGEKLGFNDYYYMTAPTFKTQSGKYEWLTESLFICSFEDTGTLERVQINVFKILQANK